MESNLSVHQNNTLPPTEMAHQPALAKHLYVRPVMFVELQSPLDETLNSILKRAVDIVVSLVLIVSVLSWLTPLLALLIILDSPGPAFFIQKRMKRAGRYFYCIKFRTMIRNAEADELAAYENDHRITRIGRFLRNRHIDELPQLLNVLMGDMSLIGPRPHMISDNLRFVTQIDNYAARHKVKPGITGLAQVHGLVGSVADNEHMKKRIEKDIYYIRNWSFRMDAAIILGTAKRVTRKHISDLKEAAL